MNGVHVSVIIPVYNGAGFIGETLDSVISQTRPGVETIVVDDGSSDRTPDIVSSFAAHYPGRITFLRTENRGPGAARNEGLKIAQGASIAFLDADDIWMPDKLERQVAVLEKEPGAGMVYCDNYFIDGSGREIPGYRRTVALYEGSITPYLFEHCFLLTSSAVVRRECVRDTGFFREDIRVGEDYDYFLRLSYRCRVRLLKEKLFFRRMLPGSLSAGDYTVNAENDIMVLHDFIRKNPGFSAAYRSRVRRRIGDYYFSLGYYLLRDGKNARAVLSLLRSLRQGLTARRLKCLVLCALPYVMVSRIKKCFSGTRLQEEIKT